jgi:hypothetical protein
MAFGTAFHTAKCFPWRETIASELQDGEEAKVSADSYNRFSETIYAHNKNNNNNNNNNNISNVINSNSSYSSLVQASRLPFSQLEVGLLQTQLAQPVPEHLRSWIDPTGAYIIAEFDRHFGIISTDRTLSYVHCAGKLPGMAEYAMARAGFYTHGVVIPVTDEFMFAGPHSWRATGGYFPNHSRLVTGPCGLSDIRLFSDYFIQLLEQSQPQDLFMADAPFPAGVVSSTAFPETGESDETRYLPWLAAEIKLLVSLLREQGKCILRVYHWFMPSTVELLWLLSAVFRKVALCRSKHSELGSGEHYFIGLGFKVPSEENLRWLQSFLSRRARTDPFEPLLDFAKLFPLKDFLHFEKAFLDVRARAVVKFRTKCLQALSAQEGDYLAKILLRFHNGEQGDSDDCGAFENMQLGIESDLIYMRPSVLQADHNSPQVLGFLSKLSCEHHATERGSYLLAALIPARQPAEHDPEHKTNISSANQSSPRKFLFFRAGQKFELGVRNASRTASENEFTLLIRDYGHAFAPGTIVEILPETEDFVHLKILRVLMVPELSQLCSMQDLKEQERLVQRIVNFARPKSSAILSLRS